MILMPTRTCFSHAIDEKTATMTMPREIEKALVERSNRKSGRCARGQTSFALILIITDVN